MQSPAPPVGPAQDSTYFAPFRPYAPAPGLERGGKMNINRLGDHIAWQEIRSLTCDYQGFHGARLASAIA